MYRKNVNYLYVYTYIYIVDIVPTYNIIKIKNYTTLDLKQINKQIFIKTNYIQAF